MNPNLKKILEASYAFAGIERDIIYPSQKKENDAEHSYQLALAAWYIIEKDKLDLDLEKAFKLCLAHDLVEIYAGDTPLWGESGHDDKEEREAKALEILKGELASAPSISEAAAEYRVKESKEAKFASGLDKLLPFLNQLSTAGECWKRRNVSMERALLVLEKQSKICEHLTKYFDEAIDYMKTNEEKFFNS